MITDIPSSEDYKRAGTELLISAWGKATSLLVNRADSEIQEASHGMYFASIQTDLRSATALVQQAIEFYLKGRICEVSPFLLIASRPETWPRDCARNDTTFSSFRTLDAQDLTKVVNTVCIDRLSDSFVSWFNALRNQRNKIIHSATGTDVLEEIDVIRIVLEATRLMELQTPWMEIRRASLVNSTENILANGYDITDTWHKSFDLAQLQREFVTTVDHLSAAESLLYFSFDQERGRHTCANCLAIREGCEFFELKNEEEYYLATAIEKQSGKFYCLFCKDESWVDEEELSEIDEEV